MIIKISNLLDGEHTFSSDEKIENLELAEPFFGNISTEVLLIKAHNQLILKAESVINAKFECDRCGDEFESELQSDYQMVYLMDQTPEETDAINIAYLPAESVQINIIEDVRDFVLLSVPMKKLCSEDCKGLCPRCGENLNANECKCSDKEVDPRWKPLIELKNKIINN